MELLTAEDVAKQLGYNAATIRRFTRQRKLDVVIIGRNHKYTQESVDKFIKEHTLPAKYDNISNECNNGENTDA